MIQGFRGGEEMGPTLKSTYYTYVSRIHSLLHLEKWRGLKYNMKAKDSPESQGFPLEVV